MKRLRLKFKWWRSRVIKWSLELDFWAHKKFAPTDVNGSIDWRDHVRWYLEGISSRIFSWAYTGSDEEVKDGIDFALDGTPDKYLSPVQKEIKYRLCEWVDEEVLP